MRWVAAITMAVAFALAAPAPALAAPPPYYPPIEYVPAARANYDVGRTMAITQIVIHETGGTWFSAVNWFQNPRSRVSAHYLVKAWGGGILQFVAESDTAFQARVANPYSIGIEHEFDPARRLAHRRPVPELGAPGVRHRPPLRHPGGPRAHHRPQRGPRDRSQRPGSDVELDLLHVARSSLLRRSRSGRGTRSSPHDRQPGVRAVRRARGRHRQR